MYVSLVIMRIFWRNLTNVGEIWFVPPCQRSFSVIILSFRADSDLNYIRYSIPASQISRPMPIIKTSRLVVIREVSDIYCGTHTKHPLWVERVFQIFQRVMHVDTSGLCNVNMPTFLSISVDHRLVKIQACVLKLNATKWMLHRDVSVTLFHDWGSVACCICEPIGLLVRFFGGRTGTCRFLKAWRTGYRDDHYVTALPKTVPVNCLTLRVVRTGNVGAPLALFTSSSWNNVR